MEDFAPRLRRRAGRSARTALDLVRPLPRDIDALVAAQTFGPQAIRRAAKRARVRDDRHTQLAALLRLQSLKSASASEQRTLRALTAAAYPAPPSKTKPAGVAPTAAPSPPSGDPGTVLTLTESPTGRPGKAVLTARAGAVPVTAWRAAWGSLPSGLADQLVTCVLTRAASRHRVTAVVLELEPASPAHSMSPNSMRLRHIGAAVAQALGQAPPGVATRTVPEGGDDQ